MSARSSRRSFVAGVTALVLCTDFASAHEAATEEAARKRASELAKDPLAGRFGGRFQLTDHSGRRVSDADFRGRFMLVYFGFTECTDTCPVDIPAMVQAVDLLGPVGARVTPVFMTVDPDDTPERMAEYVARFHPRLVGLTGSEPELAAVARAYKVHRRRLVLPPTLGAAASGPSAGPQGAAGHQYDAAPHRHDGQKYTIDHGSLMYLMNPEGRFLTLFPTSTSGERIAAVLRKYVGEEG